MDPPSAAGATIEVGLRRGWSITNNGPTATECVTGGSDQSISQDVESSLGEVDDSGSVARGLNISAQVQAHALFASIDAETNYALKTAHDYSNTNIAINGKVRITESLEPTKGNSADDIVVPSKNVGGSKVADFPINPVLNGTPSISLTAPALAALNDKVNPDAIAACVERAM